MRIFVSLSIFTILMVLVLAGCKEPAPERASQSNVSEQKYSDIGAPICEVPSLRADKSILVTVSGGRQTDSAFVTDGGRKVPADHFTVNVSGVKDKFNLILYNVGDPVMFDIVGQKRKIAQIISYGSAAHGPDYFAVKGGEGKSRIVEVAMPPDPAETEDMLPQHARRADSACNPRHYFYDAKDLTVLAATGEEYPNGFPYLDLAISATAAVEVSISQNQGQFSAETLRNNTEFPQVTPQSVYSHYLAMREAVVKIEHDEWHSFRKLGVTEPVSEWEELKELSRSGRAWLNTSPEFDDKLAEHMDLIDLPLERIDAIVIDSEEIPKYFASLYIGYKRVYPTILLLPNSEGSFSTNVSTAWDVCFINSRTGELSRACKSDTRW